MNTWVIMPHILSTWNVEASSFQHHLSKSSMMYCGTHLLGILMRGFVVDHGTGRISDP